MLAGFYTIASGMLTRQRELDVIGNNLVNVQTPGYRADRVVTSAFEQQLLTRREAYQSGTVGNGVAATSATVDEVLSLFQGGTIKQTGRAYDVAIGGEGFFQIQAEGGGQYMTRNGQFDIDEEGYLVLPGYGRVLGDGGEIQVGEAGFEVAPTGEIYDAQGQQLGKLKITVPPEDTRPVKLDNGMFELAEGEDAQDFVLSQGSLELSNVDMNQELTTLIEVQRAFQNCSAALQIVDTMNRKAASQLASL